MIFAGRIRPAFPFEDGDYLAVTEYVRNQLQEDIATDQISMKEYVDPFTGDKNKKA